MTPSVAALIALGPKPGIVRKLAELHDFYPSGRLDSGRHRTERRVGNCWMTWAYSRCLIAKSYRRSENSIDFRKRAFVRPILADFFLLMEAMEDAAHELGLPREAARLLTLQTAFGAATLALESEEGVAKLRKRVTSPGGTTERAIQTFESGGLRTLVGDAVRAAKARSAELADSFGGAA